MALVFWKHRDNIERLRTGKEHSWKKSELMTARTPWPNNSQKGFIRE
jgi:hypothetical protein